MASGLYDASYEHDACGVGMVADLHGRPDHDIVDKGLTVLERLAHRGASGAEVSTGDGAGKQAPRSGKSGTRSSRSSHDPVVQNRGPANAGSAANQRRRSCLSSFPNVFRGSCSTSTT